ncbi:hypothetical protein QLX08_011107 [Tetragonisca angustula]|uniref:Uncharacterized protein n=1 Tax=Tetragonisca angustula TaxID=166442 RepID=A0AAW0Z9R1_9HYME
MNRQWLFAKCEDKGRWDTTLTQAPQCSDEEGPPSRHFQSLSYAYRPHPTNTNGLSTFSAIFFTRSPGTHTEASLPVQNTRTASLAQPLSDTLELTR